ncbi:U-box domain-containing protein 25-like [Diospyros lotus]|uniref:U-box domain-containing protein 25-like n=1 Tax=Diospyros lotus TaxID=55363 RepID=UPI00225B54AB|nr:U-box domain-containing protein 25-like [Diospyros lotus]
MKGDELVVPHLFRCPISLDLFTDPVTLCTGQTYDRSSIEKWLSAGNLTCPVTMQKLHDTSMVPNHTLRHLIDQWLRMGNQSEPSDCGLQILHPNPSIAALKHSLESHHSPVETGLQTLERIRVLAEELPSKNSCLIQLGFFSLLLELAFGHVEDEVLIDNLKFVEQALVCALKLLPYCSLRPLDMLLKEESKLEYFLVLLNHGNITINKCLCQLVEAISSSLEAEELHSMLENNRRLLQGLVLLFRDNSGASESSIKALSSLCSSESSRENLVREGMVEALIACILSTESRHETKLAATAMSMLELLLGLESARQALMSHPSGVDGLVKMTFRVSDHQGSDSAVSSLMIVCSSCVEARERAISAGVLTQLLLLLQSQCSGRAKAKARMLLKLLRSTWARDSTHSSLGCP